MNMYTTISMLSIYKVSLKDRTDKEKVEDRKKTNLWTQSAILWDILLLFYFQSGLDEVVIN